jgi:hypothetical protein
LLAKAPISGGDAYWTLASIGIRSRRSARGASVEAAGMAGGGGRMQEKRRGLKAAWRRWGARDRLARAMVVNWAFGMAIGGLCAALLLALDFVGLRSLLWRSDALIPGVALLCASFAFTFGGVVCAAAVMGFEADDDSQGRPRGLRLDKAPPRRLSVAPIAADPPHRRV